MYSINILSNHHLPGFLAITVYTMTNLTRVAFAIKKMLQKERPMTTQINHKSKRLHVSSCRKALHNGKMLCKVALHERSYWKRPLLHAHHRRFWQFLEALGMVVHRDTPVWQGTLTHPNLLESRRDTANTFPCNGRPGTSIS